MSLRISRIKAGLTGAISRSGAMNGDDPVSINTRILPVPPVTPLARHQTYKKMRFGQTTSEQRLKNAGRAFAGATGTQSASIRAAGPAAPDDNSSTQSDLNSSTSALAGLISDTVKPRTGKPVPTRKAMLQLRMQIVRKQRKPKKGLGRTGLDHDTLPGNDGLHPASEMTSDHTPAVRGPFDPALPISKTDSTRPYLLPQPAEAARRQQIEKLF